MNKYICTDGNADLEIEADSAKEAAQSYVDDGDWGERTETIWVDVTVTPIIPAAKSEDVLAAISTLIDSSNITEYPDSLLVSVDEGYDIDTLIAVLPAGSTAEWAGSGETNADGHTTEDINIEWCDISDEENAETITITLEADEPDCDDGEDHDWQSPHSVVGGLTENPGVHGHGGGVIITEVCARCGTYRITDTWAQNRSNGRQGLTSVTYRKADEESLAWVEGLKESAE